VPPAKQGDYAYLLHIIRSLKSTGRAACILPHGVLFRGNAEAEIRKNLVRAAHQGHHRPAGQPVLRHRHPGLHPGHRQGRRGGPQGHLHDRRRPGLHEGRPKNRLRERDIHRIVDAFTRQTTATRYARMVG
jgi:type I restriction enzyme M protein